MAVFRVEKNKNYTVMSNTHLRDQALSLKAKGLLSMILSLPDNWHYNVKGLAAISKEGRTGIMSALRELEQTGYLTRHQLRDEHGLMSQIEYVIYEQPNPPQSRNPTTVNPPAEDLNSDQPYSVEPTAGFRTQSSKEEQIQEKYLILSIPYLIVGYLADKLGWLYRVAEGTLAGEKLLFVFSNFQTAFQNPLPSFYPQDSLVGVAGALIARGLIYMKQQDAKKFRQGVEYGSARWGTPADIKPYVDENPDNNIILSQTERLTMNSRPKNPKYARNKNILVIGGSGSGKTRFFIKPSLLQQHSSYVVTDPKGTLLVECGRMLERGGYAIRSLNTINFKKSMHYNPFVYIRSEKDILGISHQAVSKRLSKIKKQLKKT